MSSGKRRRQPARCWRPAAHRRRAASSRLLAASRCATCCSGFNAASCSKYHGYTISPVSSSGTASGWNAGYSWQHAPGSPVASLALPVDRLVHQGIEGVGLARHDSLNLLQEGVGEPAPVRRLGERVLQQVVQAVHSGVSAQERTHHLEPLHREAAAVGQEFLGLAEGAPRSAPPSAGPPGTTRSTRYCVPRRARNVAR